MARSPQDAREEKERVFWQRAATFVILCRSCRVSFSSIHSSRTKASSFDFVIYLPPRSEIFPSNNIASSRSNFYVKSCCGEYTDNIVRRTRITRTDNSMKRTFPRRSRWQRLLFNRTLRNRRMYGMEKKRRKVTLNEDGSVQFYFNFERDMRDPSSISSST